MAKREKKDTRKRRKEIDDPDLKKVLARISANLKKKRAQESLQSVATRARVSTATVWELEHERAHNVKLHTLVTVARALDMDLADLIR